MQTNSPSMRWVWCEATAHNIKPHSVKVRYYYYHDSESTKQLLPMELVRMRSTSVSLLEDIKNGDRVCVKIERWFLGSLRTLYSDAIVMDKGLDGTIEIKTIIGGKTHKTTVEMLRKVVDPAYIINYAHIWPKNDYTMEEAHLLHVYVDLCSFRQFQLSPKSKSSLSINSIINIK